MMASREHGGFGNLIAFGHMHGGGRSVQAAGIEQALWVSVTLLGHEFGTSIADLTSVATQALVV